MDHGHAHRPTSGASAAELVAQLREARHRTRRLTEDLSSSELMGPRLEIVNPVLWEIGHVGWFHEYWTLRHTHGRAPLIERGDRLWDSSAVPHATRWQLDLPDRAGTFGYKAEVSSYASGGRTLYRVRVGPQRTRAEADAAASALRAHGIKDARVVAAR